MYASASYKNINVPHSMHAGYDNQQTCKAKNICFSQVCSFQDNSFNHSHVWPVGQCEQ